MAKTTSQIVAENKKKRAEEQKIEASRNEIHKKQMADTAKRHEQAGRYDVAKKLRKEAGISTAQDRREDMQRKKDLTIEKKQEAITATGPKDPLKIQKDAKQRAEDRLWDLETDFDWTDAGARKEYAQVQKEQEQERAHRQAVVDQAGKALEEQAVKSAQDSLEALSPEEDAALNEYIMERENHHLSTINPMMENPFGPLYSEQTRALLDKYGKTAVDAMASVRSREDTAEVTKAMEDYGREQAEKGGLHAAAASLLTIPAQAMSSPVFYIDAVVNAANGRNPVGGIDPNYTGNVLNRYTDSVRGTVAKGLAEKGLAGKAGSWLYQAAMNVFDNAERALHGSVGGAVLAATQSFSRVLSAATEQGATPAQAALLATANAGIEFLTEKIPLDDLISVAKGTNAGAIIKNLLRNAGIEAATEELSLLGTVLAEAAILRENSGYQQEIQGMIDGGMSPEEAKEEANRGFIDEAINTMIVSGLAGGVGGLGASLRGQQVQADADYQAMQQAQEAETESPAQSAGQEEVSVQEAAQSPAEAVPGPVEAMAAAVVQNKPQTEQVQQNPSEDLVNRAVAGMFGRNRIEEGNPTENAESTQTPADIQAGDKAEANGNPAQESDYYDEFEDWGAYPNREGVGNPLADRNFSEVGKRSTKAYMYENPAVKPFYQEQAAWLLSELTDTTRGERTYNDNVYYESGGEKGWSGTKRHTSESIAELLDQYGMTYEQIERGLNAIVNDSGQENNAISKRIEFVINDRLMNGYTDFYSGERVPGNAEYLNLLRSQQQAEDNGQPVPEGMKGTGAAEQNFSGKADYADLLREGNVQRDRPGDVRPVEVPKKDGSGRRVTEFAGNAYGAAATPDHMANEIESLIQDGKMGFDTRSNQESLQRAAEALGNNTEGVKAQITENLAKNMVQDGDIEKVMLLYVKNANSKAKADQEAAAQLLVQLGQMANISGRNLQLFSMLRRMTPEGQLMYAQKAIDKEIARLNKGRSKRKRIVGADKQQAENAVEAARLARDQVESAVKEAGRRVRYEDGTFKTDGDPAMSKYVQKVGEALVKYAKGESGDKKPVQIAVRSALKDIAETLSSVVRSSGQKKDTVEARIVEVLINKHKFSEPDASKVAEVVKEQYRDMVKEKAKSILEKKFQQRKPAKRKTSDQIFDELANLGAFDVGSKFNQAAAEKWLDTKDVHIAPELAQEYLNAKTDAEKEMALNAIYMDAAAKIEPTLGEVWDAWRNMAMLMNPKTHIRNIGATGAFQPFVQVKRMIGTGLEKALLGKDQRTKSVLGADSHSRDLLAWAKADAKNPSILERMGQTYSTGNEAQSKIQEYRKILPGGLDKMRKANMDIMEREDRFFKKGEYARSLASFLKARGYTAQDLKTGMVPAGILEEGRTLAIKEAQKATFNDRNAFSDTVAKLGRGVDKIPVIGKIVSKGALPFLRTPANVVARAWDYSPMKLAQTFYQVNQGSIDAATAIDQVSGALTGSAAMALGVALAAGIVPDVELVGKLEDEDEKENGALAYSLRIGDKYYSVSWLSPAMIPLFIGANLHDKFQTLGEENGMDGWDVAQALMEVGADALDPMLELSMLSSLNDMVDAAAEEDTAGGKAIALFLNAATSYFTQGLPTIFGQAEQATETEKSSTYVNTDNKVERVIKKALGSASQRVPTIDLFQTPRLDEFGQVVQNEGDALERAFNAFLNPFTTSKAKTDPINQELSRLRKAGAENASIPLPQRTISYTDTDGEKHADVRLSQEQFQKLAEKQGQTEQAVLSALLDSDDFRAMSDEVKDDVLALVHSYAKETGELAAIENHLGYSATWMEELAEAEDPAKYIVQRVSGTNLNRAMTDLDTAWGHGWNTKAKERALDEAYEEYKSMSKEAQKEIEAFTTGTAKKYLEARGKGISHEDFLAAAKNVETVKGTGKYNADTGENSVRDIDKREAIAKTTGLSHQQIDIIMKAYMPDYDKTDEQPNKTELKYDYVRKEMDMSAREYARTYRAYLDNKKKAEKIAAIQALGYDHATANRLYKLYAGRVDVVAWAGK